MLSQRPEDRLVVGITRQVAETLVPFLPDDSRIYAATRQMQLVNPELCKALFTTISDLRAAARQSRAARKELAVVGNPAEEMRDSSPEWIEKEVPPELPAGVRGDLLRSEEVAGLLDLSVRRVRQLCISKELVGEKPGIEWIITRESVGQYLAIRSQRKAA